MYVPTPVPFDNGSLDVRVVGAFNLYLKDLYESTHQIHTP